MHEVHSDGVRRRMARRWVGLAAAATMLGAVVVLPPSGSAQTPVVKADKPDKAVKEDKASKTDKVDLADAPAAPADGAPSDTPTTGKAPEFLPATVLVGFQPGAPASSKATARSVVSSLSAKALSKLTPDTEKLTLPPSVSVDLAIAALKNVPGVRYAEPDWVVQPTATADDPYVTNGSLWGMGSATSSPASTFGSQAADAWADGATGSASVAVGIIDEGFKFDHPDLAANAWTNPGDTPDGVDNDQNGYVDDVRGWDFFHGDNTTYDAADGDDHGTHVAGTIGAKGGNATGVAGVNWDVKLISGKFLGPNGGATSDAVKAIDYFTDLKVNRGVNVVATSNSWSGGGFSQALLDAINRGGNAGILFVAAASNSSANNDTTATYPANYQCTNGGTRGWDCVIAVASITSTGSRSSFSNYGKTTVDLGAPGSDIWSTVSSGYASYNGTSMATPHVSGALALCAAVNPTLNAQQRRNAVVQSVASTPSLVDMTVTGGRLDVASMVRQCRPAAVAAGGAPDGVAAAGIATSRIDVVWNAGTATNVTGYEVQRAPRTNGVCGSYTSLGLVGDGFRSFTVTGLSASTPYCFRVRGTNTVPSVSGFSPEVVLTTASPPTPYTCSPTTYAWIDATGGTLLAQGDDTAVTLGSLPFPVKFYGGTTSSVQVGSNGLLVLGGGGGATAYANTTIPASAEPNGLVAPLWDDLTGGTGGVYTTVVGTAPNRRLVVSWVRVGRYAVAGDLSFQAVIDESTGAITLAYQDVVVGSSSYDYGRSATVGLESTDGVYGTLVSYNAVKLANSSAYRCSDAPPPAPATITTASLPNVLVNTPYSEALAATGGQLPYAWAMASASALPAGLTLSSAGVISGTPTAPGTTGFSVSVTTGDGAVTTKALSITVVAPLAVTTTSVGAATVGTPYTAQLASTGGVGSSTWSIDSGTLPPGVTLSSAGLLSGAPTAPGPYAFVARATNAGPPSQTAVSPTLTIVVSTAPVLPGAFGKTSPANGANNVGRPVTIQWAASAGATSYEYCVSRVNNDPACTWTTTSSTQASLTTLNRGTTYYWQVRARNADGATAANSGSFWRFKTR